MNLGTDEVLAPVKFDGLRESSLEGLLDRGVANLALCRVRALRFGLLDTSDVHNRDDFGALNHIFLGGIIRLCEGAWRCASAQCRNESCDELSEG